MTTRTATARELRQLAQRLLDSIVAKNPGMLPLAPRYRATENAIPANLAMMTAYRLDARIITVGASVADPERGTVVVFANLEFNGSPTVFWARLHIAADVVDEVEIYHTASRAAAGYVSYPEEIGTGWPEEWTRELPAEGRASRDELDALGRAIYDADAEGPASAERCVLMEQGGIVHEYIDFMELMFDEPQPEHEPEDTAEMYGVGLDPFRPHDPDARVWAVDEESGVVAVIGTVRGVIMPTVTRAANISAFVPESMIEMHGRSILPEHLRGRSVIEQGMPVTSFNTQIWRLYDGQVQGVQMYNFLTASGADYPWT